MKIVFLILSLLLVVSATAREQVPSTARCRAEAALWGNEDAEVEYAKTRAIRAPEGAPNLSGISGLDYAQVNSRVTEMYLCVVTDQARQHEYLDISWFYESVEHDRESDFIRSHDLWDQFMLEDRQGKR